MIVLSDSLPVQFWLPECDTYNEQEVVGINPACWNQPFNCDDPIVTQFTDEESLELTLLVRDQENNTLVELEIEEIIRLINGEFVGGLYQVVLLPEEENICDQKIQLVIMNGETELAKSDGLHIKEDHQESTLFEYRNNRNFDGLVYDDSISPEQNFFIRVPGVFYHPRDQQEDKGFERTSSTVVTSSKIKKQKLLQVPHAPHYFHTKLTRVLSHQTLIAHGKQWKKEEAYEKDEGDLRYPLKKAMIWLTEKNSLRRNVL